MSEQTRGGSQLASRQILSDLLGSVRDVVWTASVDDGSYLFMNPATALVYGRPREDFMADPRLWLELVHPEDRERVVQASEQLSAQGALELEYRIIRSDGAVRWVRDRKFAIRDDQGRATQLGGIAADITAEVLLRGEHEQLERDFLASARALRQVDEKYHNLFESAGDPVYTITLQGEIAALNAAWERTTGHQREAWIGRTFEPLVHPDDLAQTREHFGAALAGARQLYEARYRTASGDYRVAEHTLAPLFDPDGAVVEIIGVARDITERREAERERRRLEQQLQQSQKLESLGLLAGGIAHDFNNLLVGVLGEADIALQDLPADAPQRGSLETIISSSQRLAAMANQMLAYSGKGRFLVARVDLSTVVHEIVKLLGASLSKKVTLCCDLAPAPLLLEADTSQLQQVVMNLVINAAEALGEAGGRVEIKTREQTLERELWPAGWPGEPLAPGRYLVLEVTDAGEGMDPQTMAQLFEPFYTTKTTGRGLGLAAVLGIIRGHRGAIEVESAPGQGSTFRVFFRPAEGAAAQETEPDGQAQLIVGSGTLLVVDDEALTRDVASGILTRRGYSVLTAADGQLALELLDERAGAVDLVLLDLTMPRMDGPEAFREIRRRWPALPVIVTSGYDQGQIPPEMRQRCAFLQKPFRVRPLVEVVQRVLAAREPR